MDPCLSKVSVLRKLELRPLVAVATRWQSSTVVIYYLDRHYFTFSSSALMNSKILEICKFFLTISNQLQFVKITSQHESFATVVLHENFPF